MSVQVSYNQQLLLGLIFIAIIIVVIEIGIKTYEFFSPPCDFIDAYIFNDMDFGIKRALCLDSVQLSATSVPITLYKPNQEFETMTINSHGFRGAEFSKVKTDNTFRIFVVGGSSVFGFGSTDETTISGYLQNKLNKSEKNVEVINAGIGAAWSFSEEFLIEKFLVDYEPDLIVVYSGANDARYRILPGEERISATAGIGDILPNFYRTPYFLNDHVFRIGFTEKIINSEFDNELIVSISSIWSERMQKICEIGKNNNFDVIITLQPMLATENRELYEDEIIFKEKHLNRHEEHAVKIYAEMKNSIKTLKECTFTQDLTQVFQNIEKPVYWDDVHISEEGNRIVADELFKIIWPMVN